MADYSHRVLFGRSSLSLEDEGLNELLSTRVTYSNTEVTLIQQSGYADTNYSQLSSIVFILKV